MLPLIENSLSTSAEHAEMGSTIAAILAKIGNLSPCLGICKRYDLICKHIYFVLMNVSDTLRIIITFFFINTILRF
jgi:hypothetical protein